MQILNVLIYCFVLSVGMALLADTALTIWDDYQAERDVRKLAGQSPQSLLEPSSSQTWKDLDRELAQLLRLPL